MTSRNSKYEQSKRQQGLVKVTLWVPALVSADFGLAASLCCENRQLTVANLRDMRTGRLVTMQAPVTDDRKQREL